MVLMSCYHLHGCLVMFFVFFCLCVCHSLLFTGPVTGEPKQRKALIGGIVAIVVVVIIIVILALVFGYFKGRMRRDDHDIIDDRQKPPQEQELVVKPQHSGQGVLLDKNGEPTFDSRA